jgi:hypothetical protein
MSPLGHPQTLLTGLAFGESPRWRDGRLWLSDWGAHEALAVDAQGNGEVVASLPSFPSCIETAIRHTDWHVRISTGRSAGEEPAGSASPCVRAPSSKTMKRRWIACARPWKCSSARRHDSSTPACSPTWVPPCVGRTAVQRQGALSETGSTWPSAAAQLRLPRDYGDLWVSGTIAILAVVAVILIAFFIPTDRKLLPMIEREIADRGGGEIQLSQLSAAYIRKGKLEGALGTLMGILLIVAVYFMTTKPGL